MFPLWAGLAVGQQLFNAGSDMFTNVANRKFAREQYNRQRQDSLADWEMQNAYNSPKAQMARFKEAGLNPNLIYGQMQPMQPVRSSSASTPQATAPRVSLSDIYSFQAKATQNDLLQEQKWLLSAKTARERAETVKTLSNVDLTNQNVKRGAIKLAIENQLQDVEVSKKLAEKESAEYIRDINYWKSFFAEQNAITNRDKMVSDLKNSQLYQNLQEAKKREVDARINLMDKEGKIKDYEIKLNRSNTSGKDKLWERLLMQIFGEIFE